jgi:uncharacterized membrane protein
MIRKILILSLFVTSLVYTKEPGVVERLTESKLKAPLVVFLISMLPIAELRGSIPVAICHYKMSVGKSYLISIIGNVIPGVLILLFLSPFSRFLSRWRPFKKFFDWLFAHTRSKSKIVEEYKLLGLTLFVGIPLPITGAWTGSIAAFLLGMRFRDAILGVFFGVLIAGVIVTTLSKLGIVGAVIAGVVLLFLCAISMFRVFKKSSNVSV